MEVAERQTILSPGFRLGCYKIESFLGQGGFGVTYLALDTMLDLPVAIKEYMPESLASRASDQSVLPRSPESAADFKWGLSSFIKEAQTLARFKHPNIVRVMSVFELNGTAYMVMEYENGQDLKAIFSHSGTLPQQRLEQIIGPIVDGLEEVHRHGYIHRDIKPANIRIRNDGTPVLLDFGSARQAAGSHSTALTALVSAGYAPLEQYTGSDGNQQGPWTDIYALGAVLYFAVTGDAPIDSALRGSALLNDKPDPLIALTKKAPSGYSPAFCRAIDWALSFKVAQRPQTIEQWRVRLLGESGGARRSPEQKPRQQELQNKAHNQRADLPDSFFEEIDRHASQSDTGIDESLFTARTLGPDDPTVVHVRPSDKPANTARFDRSSVADSVSGSDPLWDTAFINDRPVPTRADERQIGVHDSAKTGNHRFKKLTAVFVGSGLALAMLVLVFPSLLSMGNWQAASVEPVVPAELEVTELVETADPLLDASPVEATSVPPVVEEPDVVASETTQVPQREQLPVAADDDSASSGASDDAGSRAQPIPAPESQTGDNIAQSEDSQAAARAVQAAEAQKQLEIERKRAAERERVAQLEALRSIRDESAVNEVEESVSGTSESSAPENVLRQFPSNDAYRPINSSVPSENRQVAPASLDPRPDTETAAQSGNADAAGIRMDVMPSSDQSAATATDNLIASLDLSENQSQEQARSFRPAITDRDMAVVLRQFDALSLAIEKRDGTALRKLTVQSERKYAYFDYLFRTFDVIEAGVTNIRGNRQDQTITGTMYIRRMIRSNGDIAFPPSEFKNIALYSVRNGDWSKINW